MSARVLRMDRIPEFKIPRGEPRGVTFDRMVIRVQLLTKMVNYLMYYRPGVPTPAELQFVYDEVAEIDAAFDAAERKSSKTLTILPSSYDAIALLRQFHWYCHCVAPRPYPKTLFDGVIQQWCEYCNKYIEDEDNN